MNAELWSVLGTAIATLVLVVVPGVVYSYYVLEGWIDDKTSYEKALGTTSR